MADNRRKERKEKRKREKRRKLKKEDREEKKKRKELKREDREDKDKREKRKEDRRELVNDKKREDEDKDKREKRKEDRRELVNDKEKILELELKRRKKKRELERRELRKRKKREREEELEEEFELLEEEEARERRRAREAARAREAERERFELRARREEEAARERRAREAARARERAEREFELEETSASDSIRNKANQGVEKVQFNIEHVNEEQVFEKPQHGIKLVIPPSSVPDHQSIDITIQPVPTDTFTLPPDVRPVSCFYEFGTSGSFTKPIQLHIQHNVDFSSPEDTSRLAFVIGIGPPPYQFELCEDDQQMQFAPRDNAGVISMSHFATRIFGIVWKVIDKIFPPKVYTIYPFYKQMDTTCWQVKVFITENLSVFLEMILKNMNEWAKIDPKAFKFKTDAITLTYNETNQTFDITEKTPLEVDKDEVDQCQPNSSAFPHMHVEAKLKKDYTLTDLKFEFEGTVKKLFFMITEVELKSSVNSMPKGVESLSDELLDMKPKKSHLTTVLNSIKYQWREIGIQLEIKDGELQSIRFDGTLSDTGKLSGVLQLWMDGKTTANDGSRQVSWRKILNVVKTPPIENIEVHEEMVEFLSHPDIQQQYLSSAGLAPAVPPPKPPSTVLVVVLVIVFAVMIRYILQYEIENSHYRRY